MSAEGDVCLTKHRFIKDHDIIYWNLIWFYERINLSSHLPELWLNNDKIMESHNNLSLIGVRTMWDNENLYKNNLPMYLQWKQQNNSIEERTLVSRLI